MSISMPKESHVKGSSRVLETIRDTCYKSAGVGVLNQKMCKERANIRSSTLFPISPKAV